MELWPGTLYSFILSAHVIIFTKNFSAEGISHDSVTLMKYVP